MKDIIELLAPHWRVIVLMALGFLSILLAAYLLGEWRGSRHTYEPLPAESLPPREDFDADALHLAEEIVTTASIAVVTADIEDVEHTAALANRYRREALVATKRANALAELIRLRRRPPQKVLEKATIEVKGREVPLIPKGH